jgi:hypothetical protein
LADHSPYTFDRALMPERRIDNMPAKNSAPRRPVAKPMSAAVAKKTAPAPKKPAAGYTDDSKITVLVADPVLRGSRKDRWPLVQTAKTVGALRTALGAKGYDTSGTLRWLQKAELVKLG